MSFLMEGRISDSPYVEMIWRGRAGSDYAPLCPADGHWNLLFLGLPGKVQVFVEGPLTEIARRTPRRWNGRGEAGLRGFRPTSWPLSDSA